MSLAKNGKHTHPQEVPMHPDSVSLGQSPSLAPAPIAGIHLARASQPPASNASYEASLDLDAAIASACKRIPPLWTLRNFVAVNPYLGFTDKPFPATTREVDRIFHASMFLPVDAYRERYRNGRIRDEDLAVARNEAAAWLDRPALAADDDATWRHALLEAPIVDHVRGEDRVETIAERVDRRDNSHFATLVVEEISKFCAARFDAGQAAWPMSWASLPVFAAWRAFADEDLNPEIRGLTGFRKYVRGLPDDPRDAIAEVLARLAVPAASVELFLARQLASIAGWAGHVQYRVRETAMAGGEDDSLVHLLAIRLAFDGAVQHAVRDRPIAVPQRLPAVDGAAPAPDALSGLELAFVWQLAFEASYRRELLQKLARPQAPAITSAERPALQAVFCIDVRSEVFRRHLETLSPRIQTIGFAGFFGLPIASVGPRDTHGAARCPVLLSPSFTIREGAAGKPEVEARLAREEEHHRTFKALRLSTLTAFPFVETLGPLFSLRLLGESLAVTRPHADGRLFASRAERELAPEIDVHDADGHRTGLDLEERVTLAEGMLRNMGLVDGFAEIVLLCGHGSDTANNPYGSGLDCGACGGHRGDVNARVAAAILEDPAVRSALAERGIRIPEDTRFLAGLHHTTTDTVDLFPGEGAPRVDVAHLRDWLDAAGEQARKEREQRLQRTPSADARGAATRRSRDWSEVRPEWGLARNAAFIAAPRARTAGLDLDGRTFLHDYDAARDEDGAVLQLILTAPLVVASWINLQYYASTVDNDVFGSGNKVLHNIVGRHGVMLGNRSDLRPGLPWQSVHDGVDYVHEPMRLLAIVEAPLERIARILETQPSIGDLVANGWIRLVAREPGRPGFHQWHNGRFESVDDVA